MINKFKKHNQILIVDDELDHCKLLSKLVSGLGYEPISVNSANDALIELKKNTISVMISDLHMPGLNGIELSRMSIHDNPNVPVILLTGNGSIESAREAVNIGLFDYLEKPVNLIDLAKKIEKAIKYRENKIQENRYKNKLERYQFLFDNSIEAICILNCDFHLVDYNRSMGNLIEKPGEGKDRGRPIKTFFKNQNEFTYFEETLRDKGLISSYEIEWKKPNKKLVCVQIDAHTWSNNNINLGYQLLIKDLSKQKKREKNLLYNEKTPALEQLATGMSHEVNNALSVIRSNLNFASKIYNETTTEFYAELINCSKKIADNSDGYSPSDVSELITLIKNNEKLIDESREFPDLISDSIQSSNKILEVVKNVNSYVQPKVNQWEPYDINIGLEELTLIGKKQARKKYQIKKDLKIVPDVLCNPVELNQAFLNICENAKQAIGFDGLIEIKTYKKEGKVVCQICDDGCGIPEKDIDRVFEPFFSRKKIGMGVGLGLAVSYSIIKKINGDIKIKSKLGKGTVVQIEIPIDKTYSDHEVPNG